MNKKIFPLLIVLATMFYGKVSAAAPKVTSVSKDNTQPPVSVAAMQQSVQPAAIPLINIEINAGAGYRLFGEQINMARDSLTPTPDYYVNYFYGARAGVQPSRFGFQAGFQRHLFRAASLSAGGGYSVYNYDVAEGGLRYLFPLEQSSSDGKRIYLTFGLGINYSMLQLADQFKSGLQAAANKQGKTITFNPDPATGIGGYAEGGIVYFFNNYFFFTVNLRMSYVNTRFSGGSTNLDSWGLEMPFGIGLAF